MLVARSDGVIRRCAPLVHLSVQVIAEENGRREQGSPAAAAARYGYFTDEVLTDYVRRPWSRRSSTSARDQRRPGP
jgi:TldD protein